MQEGVDASEPDAYMDTPLHLASLFGCLDVVKVSKQKCAMQPQSGVARLVHAAKPSN